MSGERKVTIALILVAVGLLVQVVTSLWWTPLTFILFAVLGLGAVGAGATLFVWTLWRAAAPFDLPLDGRRPREDA